MIKQWYVRCLFFVDRRRIWAYFGSLFLVLGLLGYRIFPLIQSGAFDSPFDLWEAVVIGLVALPLLSMLACKVVLDILTEAIVTPKVEVANQREKPKTLKASQASDPRFESAFSRDEVELKYSRAKFKQINEDHLGFFGRWNLYWRAKRALRKRRKR